MGADYRGETDARVDAQLIQLDSGREKVLKNMSLKANKEGKLILNFGKLEPGNYSLRSQAFSKDQKIGSAEEPLIVEAAETELQSPFPRSDLLKALAQSSGGEYNDVDQSLPTIEIKDPRRVEINRTRQVPIWDTGIILTVFLALMGLQWWLRRRWGLM